MNKITTVKCAQGVFLPFESLFRCADRRLRIRTTPCCCVIHLHIIYRNLSRDVRLWSDMEHVKVLIFFAFREIYVGLNNSSFFHVVTHLSINKYRRSFLSRLILFDKLQDLPCSASDQMVVPNLLSDMKLIGFVGAAYWHVLDLDHIFTAFLQTKGPLASLLPTELNYRPLGLHVLVTYDLCSCDLCHRCISKSRQ